MKTHPIDTVIGSLNWGPVEKRDRTNGIKYISRAPANKEFWALWKAAKDDCKAAGLSPLKGPRREWIVLLSRQAPFAGVTTVTPEANEMTAPETAPESAAETVPENVVQTTPETTPVVPCPPPDIGTLLTLICDFLLRFVVFARPEQAVAVSLWIVHTWVIEAFKISPYLQIFSVVKRCGKTRLLESLGALVLNPWPVVSVTDATLFRKIESDAPTLLLDENDTIFSSSKDKSKEGLRAVLNAGFSRGATVPRCVGRDIFEFSVFCPKAFAGIGDRLPDTVKDRSVRIQLIRRTKDQPIERFRLSEEEPLTKAIVEKLAAWSSTPETIETLRAARPEIPMELGDRAADISEPLLAIADMAGEPPSNSNCGLTRHSWWRNRHVPRTR